MEEKSACPNCGYCPACGRSNAPVRFQFYPPWYVPQPSPWWQPTYPWTVTGGSLGAVSGSAYVINTTSEQPQFTLTMANG